MTLRSVSRDQPLAFDATLINPLPRGTIVAKGTFGPWVARDPGRTPVGGTFTFSRADMGTIDGLRGTLEASGAFDGVLERIGVRGETSVPDFALSVAEHPMLLSTQFDATVDGTNGDTVLNDVRAVLGKTPIDCRGRVTDAPGRSGRVVQVDATIHGGRIEDLLRLAVKGDPPLMTGGVDVTTTLVIPPGPGDVVRRMRLDAKVSIVRARFTAPAVQQKVNEFSARARKEADQLRAAKEGPPVASQMAGTGAPAERHPLALAAHVPRRRRIRRVARKLRSRQRSDRLARTGVAGRQGLSVDDGMEVVAPETRRPAVLEAGWG